MKFRRFTNSKRKEARKATAILRDKPQRGFLWGILPKGQSEKRGPMFTPADVTNLKWFWNSYLKRRSPILLVVMGMIMIQALVYQQFLQLTESGLRVIFKAGQTTELLNVCLWVFVLFATRGLMSYLIPRISISVASDAVMRMRQDMIAYMMRLDLAFFERTPTGDILLKLVNQADALSQFVGQSTTNAIRDAATIVIVSAYLIYQSPLLFSTAIIVMPCIILLMQRVSHRVKQIQATAENALGAYMSGVEEMSNGMRTVKISSQEPQERQRLFAASSGIKDISIRLQAAQALVMPVMDLVSAFVYVLVIGGGGYLVLQPDSDLDGAAIITFLVGMVLIFDPARMLAQFFTKLQASLIVLRGIHSVFDEEPSISNVDSPITEFDRKGDIVFSNVGFGYSADQPLFDGLDLVIEGGKVSAIVGATGSGKTTILSLMTRLYEVDTGVVSIGNVPINQIDIPTLRSSFSVVAQDIVIFNNSIWENIRYVRPTATEDEIWEAAENADIADLIRSRKGAPLGPKGSQLSGGQKQRIAIARAFLRSAPILLLDEATSALDQRTEERVKKALDRLSEGKTTIIVAHRLSAVTEADKIIVLDMGKVVEQGTHKELLEQGGLYSGMFGAQRHSYDRHD